MSPIVVRIDRVEIACTLTPVGRGRLRLECAADDWPGYRPGRVVELHRGYGQEWYKVEGVLRVEDVAAAVLEPCDAPKPPKAYRPPVGAACGS